MKFCKNCGKKLPDNAHFCKYCGQKQIMETKSTLSTHSNQKVSNSDSSLLNALSKTKNNPKILKTWYWLGAGYLTPFIVTLIYGILHSNISINNFEAFNRLNLINILMHLLIHIANTIFSIHVLNHSNSSSLLHLASQILLALGLLGIITELILLKNVVM